MMSNLPADNIYQRMTDLRNQTGKSQKEVAKDLDMPASGIPGAVLEWVNLDKNL